MNIQLKNRVYSSVLIGLAATCAGMTQATAANLDPGVNSVRVSYADLNLSTDAGISALYGRLQAAAKTVCGPAPRITETLQFLDWSQCRRTALTNAIEKLDHPALSELHRQKTGFFSPSLVASNGAKR